MRQREKMEKGNHGLSYHQHPHNHHHPFLVIIIYVLMIK
jgi:hypothetical protein